MIFMFGFCSRKTFLLVPLLYTIGNNLIDAK